ncbi:MAG: putative PEP-binding protein [Chromatiales bacterium]
MKRIQGAPLGPGCAQGKVRKHCQQTQAADLLVLSPQEMDVAAARHPRGLIVIGGAPWSHPVLHLLALGIPSIVLAPDQLDQIEDGEELLLDGSRGYICTPSGGIAEDAALGVAGEILSGQVFRTADGHPLELRACVESRHDATEARRLGATSIGVVRSEYLGLGHERVPDVEFFELEFRAICEAAGPLAVCIRLLDISADKRPAWLPDLPALGSLLGLQGVRLYATEPVRSVFHAQVLAIDALLQEWKPSILLPFISAPAEFSHWCREIEKLVSSPVKVSPMLETPSACLDMAEWLKLADCISIGCNDLMECFFGADRDCEAISHLLDPYSPALYRFLRDVATLAGDGLAGVQLCGFLPKLPRTLPLLIGLGYRAFAVEPPLIPYLSQSLQRIRLDEARELAQAVCCARDSNEVQALTGLTSAPRTVAA